MDREEQGRATKQIGLIWSEESKDNQSIADLVDQRDVKILDRIGLGWIGLNHIRSEWADLSELYQSKQII